jgi:hypothetical protein
VTDAGEHIFDGVQLVFGRNKCRRTRIHIGGFGSGFEDFDGERLETFLPRDRGECLLFGLEGKVEILKAFGRVGVLDLIGDLGRELALSFDRFQDGGFAFRELANLADAKLNFANLIFVEAARLILAEAGDERGRVAGVEQLESTSDFFLRQAQVARKVPQIDRRGWRHANKRTLDTKQRGALEEPDIRRI